MELSWHYRDDAALPVGQRKGEGVLCYPLFFGEQYRFLLQYRHSETP